MRRQARSKTKEKVQFGDFQTPLPLAREVCALLRSIMGSPTSLLEPTCGKGTFLLAALESFPEVRIARGFDCNPQYVEAARRTLLDRPQVQIEVADFFTLAWDRLLSELPEPILVVGNPPWVTNATQGAIEGTNLPEKRNVDRLRGIEALTGCANFDVSEAILREIVRRLEGRVATVALLCKTSVARRVLAACWKGKTPLEEARFYRIDASEAFGVSVNAGLLMLRLRPDASVSECEVFDSFSSPRPVSTFGKAGDLIVADLATYTSLSFLHTPGLVGWRSGVKHDCRRVFELEARADAFVNGFGERVDIEREVVFPLLKSSDIVHGRAPRRFILLPHRSMRASPRELKERAPAAWHYLQSHATILERRRSAIYRKRPPFSIFGIGPYSLTDWKVAVAGLSKELKFAKIGPYKGRPVVLDDTCYLFPCQSRQECEVLHDLVSSGPAVAFWSSLLFWDAKRPITAKLLNLLDLARLARHLDFPPEIGERLAQRQHRAASGHGHGRHRFR